MTMKTTHISNCNQQLPVCDNLTWSRITSRFIFIYVTIKQSAENMTT